MISSAEVPLVVAEAEAVAGDCEAVAEFVPNSVAMAADFDASTVGGCDRSSSGASGAFPVSDASGVFPTLGESY